MKTKDFINAKSFKYINVHSETTNDKNLLNIKNPITEKIELLRAPVYEKKKKYKIITENRKYMKQNNSIKEKNKEKSQAAESEYERPQTQHYRYSAKNKSKFEKMSGRKSSSGHNQQTEQRSETKLLVLVTSERDLKKKKIQCLTETKTASLTKQIFSRLTSRNNSQSLIRKSSLFLNNFLKNKQKTFEKKQNPHIAGVESATSVVKFQKTFRKSPSTFRKHKPYQQQDVPKMRRSLSKMLNSMPIDPW